MLFAFYDLDRSPVSFDFVHFLICAQKEANGDPIHVVIVPGTNKGFRQNDHKPISVAEKIWRVDHILVPLAKLAGASLTLAPTREFAANLLASQAQRIFPAGYRTNFPRAYYTMGLARRAVEEGAKPQFKASERAHEHVDVAIREGGRPVVSITMRNTHTPTRNSNRDAWLTFADALDARGYLPVIVPDTEDVSRGCSIWDYPSAAIDLDLRLALYERATMNMASSGGPFVLSLYTYKPTIYFLNVDPEPFIDENGKKHWAPTEKFFAENVGMQRGDQWPGSGPMTRIVWAKDTYENIVRAFDEVMSCREAA
jgi:hypothetical protein